MAFDLWKLGGLMSLIIKSEKGYHRQQNPINIDKYPMRTESTILSHPLLGINHEPII